MLIKLKVALGASWLLFTRGGLCIAGVASSLICFGIFRMTDGCAFNIQMATRLALLLFAFSAFLSLTPLLMTILSFIIPKRPAT